MSRQALIAKVHIAKKELALDNDTYRQALQGVTGKASCSTMSDLELDKVLEHFKRRGWKPNKAKSRKYSPKTRHIKGHDVVDKIRAVWIHMHKIGMTESGTEAALDAFVQRTTSKINGIGIVRTEWLRGGRNEKLAAKVLESLKQWEKRLALQWKNQDLLKISQEQRRTDQTQAAVAQQLLDAHAIMWWPIFEQLNIPDHTRYCQNRRKLNHG